MIEKENLGYSDALNNISKRYPNNEDYMYGYNKGKEEVNK